MAGIKGKSGRKGWREQLELKGLALKCRSAIMKALDSDELTIQDKAQLAAPILGKFIPKSIDINQNDIVLQIMHYTNKPEIKAATGKVIETNLVDSK